MLTSAALCQHKSRSLKTSALQPGMLGGIFHKIRSRAHSVSSILCILSQSKLSSSKGMSKQESELRYIIIPPAYFVANSGLASYTMELAEIC
jgi:hypothetical protein